MPEDLERFKMLHSFVRNQNHQNTCAYLIFVIFSPPTQFFTHFLHAKASKSRQNGFHKNSAKQTLWQKNWTNFRFLHICPVEKCEISSNLAKFHISPHLCGKTEIPLHVEKFHVLKSEISPHGRFFLHLHVGDRGDKYQVWLYLCLSFSCVLGTLPEFFMAFRIFNYLAF